MIVKKRYNDSGTIRSGLKRVCFLDSVPKVLFNGRHINL